jgi:hypothetical protein
VQEPDYNGPASVTRWRDGTVLWSGPAGDYYWNALPEPGGKRIAVWVSDPSRRTSGVTPVNVYVVGPDGQTVELLTNLS